MYYRERIINGVLMCKSTPISAWRQVSIEVMSKRIIEQEATIRGLQAELLGKNSEGLGAK